MKKVISLVLVVALVLGSFGMAFAADETTAPQTTATATKGLSDIDNSPNINAIKVVNDLGIVTGFPDKTFKPAQNVTRAEFAAMIVRALGVPESALAGFTTSKFTDTTGYGWAVKYLGYCSAKGIMEGYGDGTVRPGNNITVNEALTMVCRALGYVNEAKELVGSWPANYIALSQQLKLYADMSAEGIINRENAAQVIYNALTANNKYIDNEGVTRDQLDPENKPITWLKLNGGSKFKNGDAFVLNSDDANTAVININEYIGANMTAFQNGNGQIIAVDIASVFLTGKYKAAKKVFTVGDTDYYVSDDVIAKANGDKTSTSAMYVKNGVSKENGCKENPIGKSGTTLSVKLTEKTIKEIYAKIDWESAYCEKFADGDLNAAKAKFKNFEFKRNNAGDIDVNSFQLLGVDSLESIKVDNVVQVYLSGVDTGKITRVAVGTKTVEGTVTKVDWTENKEIYIDGVKYGVADGADVPALGDTGTAWLTYDGDIAFWDIKDETAGNYAVVLHQGTETTTWSGDSVEKIRLFTKDGKTVDYSLASGFDKTKLNDVVPAQGTKDIDGYAIVTYSLNKNGEVSNIKKITGAAITNDMVSGRVNEKATRFGTQSLADTVTVFSAKLKGDKLEWSVGTAAGLDKKNDITAKAGVNKNGTVVTMLVPSGAFKGNDKYGVISQIYNQLDADKDAYKAIKGIVDGKAFEGLTDQPASEDKYNKYISKYDGTKDSSYGLYRIAVDGDGVVTGIEELTLGTAAQQTTDKTVVYAVEDVAIEKTNTAKNEVTLAGGATYGLATDVVIYVWNGDTGAYEVGTFSSLRGMKATLYRTSADLDGFDVVLVFGEI